MTDNARTMPMMDDVQAARHELAAERARLQAVFAKSHDGMILVDCEGRVQQMNPTASQLLGMSPDTAFGKPIAAVIPHRGLADLIDCALRTRIPAMLDIPLMKPEQGFVNVYVAPIEAGSALIGALAMMYDITTPKYTENMRRDFVANVSHELRTPLASVRAMAETILLRSKKDARLAEEYAGKIMTEIDRLTALASDLLDLAQVEAGRRLMRMETYRFVDALALIQAKYQPLAERKAIVLRIDTTEELCVTADQDAMQQMLTNLVDNALKYTPEGGTVSIVAYAEEGRTIIRVTDSGIGIPQADQAHIFERFYRVDKARTRVSGGTGLGLAIVKHLVEAHGGKISVESTPGQGSAFTVALPEGEARG